MIIGVIGIFRGREREERGERRGNQSLVYTLMLSRKKRMVFTVDEASHCSSHGRMVITVPSLTVAPASDTDARYHLKGAPTGMLRVSTGNCFTSDQLATITTISVAS